MKKQKINTGWIFWKEGCEESKRMLDLPHDAMFEEDRNPALINGNATAFYPGGKYYYVKTIYGSKEWEGKKLLIEFEGVYMNSTVYLNGDKIGGWVYGYTNFYVDITDKLKTGEDNELKVEVDNSQTPNSRWYSGSGIYRPVNLWIGNKNSIAPQGVRIKTVSIDPAEIEIIVDAHLEENMYVVSSVLENEQCISKIEIPYSKIIAGEPVILAVPDAKKWSAQEPNLYTLKTGIMLNNQVIDLSEDTFGIRQITWNSKNGLMINGNTVKLRGGCIHHDNGLLGACTYDAAELRRVRKLKEMGYNAIRYSHNPAGKNLLDICDREGMYLLDESFDQWKVPQSAHDYALYFDEEWKKDVEALVSKDYNHPSVIMYCIGNEITDTGLPHGAMIAKMLNDEFHRLDAARPTTIAINSMLSVLAAKQAERKALEAQDGINSKEKAVGSTEVNDIIALLPKIMASITAENLEALIGECIKNVDIVGYNYAQNLYEETHVIAPERVILSTETFPARMAANWEAVEKNPYMIGDFMWTAWDYLGETGVGLPTYGTSKAPFSKPYPCLTAACGSFDLTGFPESQAYYAAVLWEAYTKPYIGVRPVNHTGEEYALGNWRLTDSIPCWTWPGMEGKIADIEVFSIGYEVELIQDGKVVERKQLKQSKAIFTTEYRPGTLEAVSYDSSGVMIAKTELATASDEDKLRIVPECKVINAGGDDLAYVAINIEDDKGILKMNTERNISVSVKGAGTLLALGSGNPITEKKFTNESYASWHGRVMAIIKSTDTAGRIQITAAAEGMDDVTAEIISRR